MKTKIFLLAAIVGLFLISSCGSTTKSTYDLLQGSWISADDAKSEVKIEGNKYIENYEGKTMSETIMLLSSECTDDSSKENNPAGQYLITFDGETIFCYFIVKLDDKNLELQFQGRGNSLIYTRK